MPELHPVVLETPRLRLRWLDDRDARDLFAIFSDPEVTRYWSRGPWTELAQAEEVLAQARQDYRNGSALRFGVELAEKPGLVGTINLYRFEQGHRCDVGYAIARGHWGKGYASESVEAMLDYGLEQLGIGRVEADIDPGNLASARVLERLGFRKEGYMPERWLVNGETADTVFYGLLKRYWDERKQLIAS